MIRDELFENHNRCVLDDLYDYIYGIDIEKYLNK